MVLYKNIWIFAPKTKHPDCSFPWALPTPGLWNKIGFCGNTMDADGISLGTVALFYCALPQAFLMKPNFYFTDTVSAALHRGQWVDWSPGPSYGNAGSISLPRSGLPGRASFPASCHWGTHFLSLSLSGTGGSALQSRLSCYTDFVIARLIPTKNYTDVFQKPGSNRVTA